MVEGFDNFLPYLFLECYPHVYRLSSAFFYFCRLTIQGNTKLGCIMLVGLKFRWFELSQRFELCLVQVVSVELILFARHE